MIYLDNASTTYPKPESVYQAMERAGRTLAVNVGRGSYGLARQAFQLVEETRAKICSFVQGNDGAEAVLTPSATIACNQVLGGLEWKKEDQVYVTPFEHNAVMRVLWGLQKRYGFAVEELALNPVTLELDLEKIQYQFLRKAPTVLVMTHVSNVTGAILPWQDVAELAEENHPAVILDGAQSLGLVPVSLRNTPVDFYIFAGHKTLYGPLGIGGYINNRGKKLHPVLFGGTGSDSLNLEMGIQEPEGYEPGSRNITAIAGLYEALKEYEQMPAAAYLQREQELRSILIKKLNHLSRIVLYKPVKTEAAGILSLNVEGYQAGEVGTVLDAEHQIAVRTGYHCAPLIHKYLKDEGYGGTVRVSLGRFTTEEELELLAEALEELCTDHF